MGTAPAMTTSLDSESSAAETRKRPRPRVENGGPRREAVRRGHVPGEHHGAVLGGPVAVDELVGDVIVRVLVHLDGDGLGAERGASEG